MNRTLAAVIAATSLLVAVLSWFVQEIEAKPLSWYAYAPDTLVPAGKIAVTREFQRNPDKMQIVVSGGVLQMDFRTDFYNRSAWGGFDFCADAIVAAHEEATRLKAEWTKKGYDVPPPNMLGCNNPDPGTWKISDSD